MDLLADGTVFRVLAHETLLKHTARRWWLWCRACGRRAPCEAAGAVRQVLGRRLGTQPWLDLIDVEPERVS